MTTPINNSMLSRVYGVANPGVVATIKPTPAAPPAAPAKNPTLARLVAASVPGKVDFSADTPHVKRTGVYSMFGRPTDRMEAATGVAAGRVIDLQG